MKKVFKIMSLVVVPWLASSSYALTPLSDSDLSDQTGQSLLSLTNIGPTDSSNLSGQDIGFYKLGIEGQLEINANIKKLQLGCGGVNGAGGCDIDIDNISLSGLGNSATSNSSSSADRAARVGSDAVLTNPFMNIAILHPKSASTRQVVGVQLGASSILGLMTLGQENSTLPSGINTLSGFLQVAATTGTARINPIFGMKPADVDNTQISGEACGYATCLPFVTNDYTLNLTTDTAGTSTNKLTGALSLAQQSITGKRINSATLKASAVVDQFYVSGNIKAVAAGLTLDKSAAGSINNLNVDATLIENLGYVHKVNLNGSAASLSLQGQDIKWPGAKSTAQTGWWLELSNPIDIGDITPSTSVDIQKQTIIDTLNIVSNKLSTGTRGDTKVDCGALGLLSCIGGSTISIGNLDLSTASAVAMGLSNLLLVNQNFTPNCYGSLKFC